MDDALQQQVVGVADVVLQQVSVGIKAYYMRMRVLVRVVYDVVQLQVALAVPSLCKQVVAVLVSVFVVVPQQIDLVAVVFGEVDCVVLLVAEQVAVQCVARQRFSVVSAEVVVVVA